MSASHFRARCYRVLDEVARTGEPVIILKRGKPVARLVPPAFSSLRYPQHELIGTLENVGDVVEPAVPADDWEIERRNI